MKLAATYQSAATLLREVLERYGKTACDTPQMFEALLRKHGRGCPAEVDVLTTALRCGVVTDLRGPTPPAPGALARVLTASARIPPAQAEWAVGAWTAALAAAPQTVAASAKAGAGRAPVATPFRVGLVLAAAALTGSLAYMIWAP